MVGLRYIQKYPWDGFRKLDQEAILDLSQMQLNIGYFDGYLYGGRSQPMVFSFVKNMRASLLEYLVDQYHQLDLCHSSE